MTPHFLPLMTIDEFTTWVGRAVLLGSAGIVIALLWGFVINMLLKRIVATHSMAKVRFCIRRYQAAWARKQKIDAKNHD